MRVKTILNHCQKFKSFVYETVCLVVETDETVIEILVVPRLNSQAICSCCSRAAPLYDRLQERRFEFVPMWG